MRIPALLAAGFVLVLALLLAGCSDRLTSSPPDDPNMVTLTVINSDVDMPTDANWVAFQDGVNGIWTPIAGRTGPGYQKTVTDPAGAYGFAVAVDNGNGVQVFIFHGLLSEGNTIDLPVSMSSGLGMRQQAAAAPRLRSQATPVRYGNTWQLTGNVTGIPDGMTYECDASSNWVIVTGPIGDFFSELDIMAGVNRDVGMIVGNGSTGYLYLRRNLNHAAGEMVGENIDFSPLYDGSKHTWQMTDRGTLTMTGAEEFYAFYHTPNGMSLPLYPSSTSGSLSYPLVPAAAWQTGDCYYYSGFNDTDGTSIDCYTPTPVTSLALPDPFTFTADTSSGVVLDGMSYPGAQMYQFYLSTALDTLSYNVYVTAAWLQAAGSTSYTVPDFIDVDGWMPLWSFSAIGAPVAWCTGYAWQYTTSFESFLNDYWFGTSGNPLPTDATYQSALCRAITIEF